MEVLLIDLPNKNRFHVWKERARDSKAKLNEGTKDTNQVNT